MKIDNMDTIKIIWRCTWIKSYRSNLLGIRQKCAIIIIIIVIYYYFGFSLYYKCISYENVTFWNSAFHNFIETIMKIYTKKLFSILMLLLHLNIY